MIKIFVGAGNSKIPKKVIRYNPFGSTSVLTLCSIFQYLKVPPVVPKFRKAEFHSVFPALLRVDPRSNVALFSVFFHIYDKFSVLSVYKITWPKPASRNSNLGKGGLGSMGSPLLENPWWPHCRQNRHYRELKSLSLSMNGDLRPLYKRCVVHHVTKSQNPTMHLFFQIEFSHGWPVKINHIGRQIYVSNWCVTPWLINEWCVIDGRDVTAKLALYQLSWERSSDRRLQTFTTHAVSLCWPLS